MVVTASVVNECDSVESINTPQTHHLLSESQFLVQGETSIAHSSGETVRETVLQIRQIKQDVPTATKPIELGILCVLP